jgi:hypothetical protein
VRLFLDYLSESKQAAVVVRIYPKYRFNLDRRSGRDRRSGKRFQFVKQLITGQRANARRSSDQNRVVYFDRYKPNLFRVTVAILVLSVADAILTVNLIGLGAIEINPVMDYYLTLGPHTFLAVKYVLTSLSVFILVIYSNSTLKNGRFPIRSFFPWIITALASVVVWEIYLMIKVAL